MFYKPQEDLNTYLYDLRDTCSGKEYHSVIEGIYIQFKDTFFFSYVIQYILILLMYIKIGYGRYWKVLHYASLAGLIAAISENVTVAYLCVNYDEQTITKKTHYKQKMYSLLIDELFWIITEYSIPYLNLIKIRALTKRKIAKLINIIICLLFIPFAMSRLCIGVARMMKGCLSYDEIEFFHGIAFGIMAVADLICTAFILHFIKSYNKRSSSHGNDITNYIQQSSYTILITVDIVSMLLSILYIVTTNIDFHTPIISRNSVLPFHCFKSVFLLILAIDALIFKYGASTNSTIRDSKENSASNKNDSNSKNPSKYPYNVNVNSVNSYKKMDSLHKLNINGSLNRQKFLSMSSFGYNPNNDIYSFSQSMENLAQLENKTNNKDFKSFSSEHYGSLYRGEYNESNY